MHDEYKYDDVLLNACEGCGNVPSRENSFALVVTYCFLFTIHFRVDEDFSIISYSSGLHKYNSISYRSKYNLNSITL